MIEEIFERRRSTRAYLDKPVSRETLEKICRLSALAPSAINAQPYNVYAISGGQAKTFAKFIQVHGRNGWADNCPAFIAIEEREPVVLKRGESTVSNQSFIGIDVGILSAYITLAAEDCGVQSCIVGLRDEKAIAEFLGREGGKFPLVVALGYAQETEYTRKRRPFEETYKFI